jgi:uncharacterized protein (TIGR02265 family)
LPADPSDLQRRIAAATDKDTVRGMIFNGAIAAVRELAGEDAVRQCLAEAGREKFVDFFSYPVADYLKLAWAAVSHLEDKLGGVHPAFFRIGHQAVVSFIDSHVGKTLVTLVSGEPRRLLANAPTAYRTAVSYGERTVSWPGQHHCVMYFKHDFLTHSFHEGVLTMGVTVMGGKNVKVVGKDTGFLEAEYEITWE